MKRGLLVAIDGGGTGCRARVYDGALAPLGESAAGPANLLAGDGSDALEAIRKAAFEALSAAGVRNNRDDVGLSASLAGATDAGRARFFAADWFTRDLRILSDTHAAVLGAHGGQDGGVVVSGTGAAACVLLAGELREIGGWGFAIDDFGSGADIGRRALRAALRRLDACCEIGPADGLAARILGRFATPGAAATWASSARPADFGALAPDVFACDEAGDPDAKGILGRAVEELDRLVALTLRAGAPRVAIVGSVGRLLAPRLGDGFDAARIVTPQADALYGAALAARLGRGWTA